MLPSPCKSSLATASSFAPTVAVAREAINGRSSEQALDPHPSPTTSAWSLADGTRTPDQAFVGRTLGGLEPTRNVTAHNNRVTDKEEDRLRIHLDDWVKQIEGRSAFVP